MRPTNLSGIANKTKTANNRKFLTKFLFIFSYVCYYVYILINHELWRDEIQHWGLAAFSNDLFELSSNLEYESRPPLWLFCLFALTRITENPEYLKLLALIIFLANTALVLNLRRFSFKVRAFTLLGFYFIYGYSVNSREYNLLMLFHLLCMKVMEKRENRLRYLVPLLIGMGLTNGYGMIFAIYWIAVVIMQGRNSAKFRSILLALTPTLLIIFLAQFYYKAPSDSIFASSINNFSFYAVKRSLMNIFVYPFFPVHGEKIPDILLLSIAMSLFAICIMLVGTLPNNYRTPLVLAISGVFLNSIFGYYLYWWHFGIVFMLFYSSAYGATESAAHWRRHKNFLSTILVLQVVGSLFGVGRDFEAVKVYSNISVASEFIRVNCDDCTLITASSVYGSPLASFIRPTKVYSVDVEDYVYFTTWKASNFRKVIESDIQESISKFSQVLVVTTQMKPLSSENFRLIGSFNNAVWDDDFQIYVPLER